MLKLPTKKMYLPKMYSNRLSTLIILFSTVVACSTTKENVVSEKQDDRLNESSTAANYQDSLEAKYNYINGLYAYETGDWERALDLFSSALVKLPASSGILFALSDAYMASDDIANALYYINEAVKVEPDNSWYWSRLAEIHERNANFKAAIEATTKLIELAPAEIEHRYYLAELFAKDNDLRQANQIYTSILKKFGDEDPVHYRLYVNYVKLGEPDSAMTELKWLIKKNSDDVSLQYNLAELQVSSDSKEDAIVTLESLLKKSPTELQALNLLLNLKIEMNQWASIEKDFNQVLDNVEISSVAKEQSGRILLTKFAEMMQKEPDYQSFEMAKISNQYLLKLSQLNQDQATPKLLLAQFYLLAKNDRDAQKVLEQITVTHENESQAWIELFQLYLRNSNLELIIEKAEKADLLNPDNAFIQYAAGASYFTQKNYKQAIKWLSKASMSPSRREFKSIIYTILGDAHNELDNWPKSSEAYEAAIKADPNNATALNNYAYYLSVRNEKLNEAKLMSKKSLDIEPDNASFLDTYGWILYQIEEYEQAKEYIMKAIDNGGSSAEVFEHLGDVYQKLGNESQAIKWWKQAYDLDPSRDYLPKRFNDAN